jgi:myo-inositol-1(or 4)-monophosphatase
MEHDAFLAEALERSLEWVREAGQGILGRYRTGIEVVRKRDNTPVTEADREAERFLRARVHETWKDHAVLGEEFGEDNPGADWRWVVDPIDGTKAFIHGMPLFGTLLALQHRGVSRLGIIHMPALAETVWAVAGQGAFLDGKPTEVSAVAELSDALLLDGSCTTVGRSVWGEAWKALREQAGLHRGWGDCYGHLLVATGRAEAMLDPVVSIWDVAPMSVILPEAGGVFTAMDGTVDAERGNALSANAALHGQILSRLQAGARIP